MITETRMETDRPRFFCYIDHRLSDFMEIAEEMWYNAKQK